MGGARRSTLRLTLMKLKGNLMLPTLFNNPPKLNDDMRARHAVAARMIRERSAN